MTRRQHLVVAQGEALVHIEGPSALIGPLAETLGSSPRDGSAGPADVEGADHAATFTIDRRDAGYFLSESGSADRVFADREDLIDCLIGRLNFRALDESTKPLHLHAGAVVFGDNAVVLPGESGSGKSTVVAASALDGAGVISDETVWVEVESGRVGGFPRPISVRFASVDLLAVRTGGLLHGRDSVYVPPAGLGSARRPDAFARAIVFPRFDRSAKVPQIRPLRCWEGIARVWPSVLDAPRAGPDLLRRIEALVGVAPAYELDYSDARVVPGLFRHRTLPDAALRCAREPRAAFGVFHPETMVRGGHGSSQFGPRVVWGLAQPVAALEWDSTLLLQLLTTSELVRVGEGAKGLIQRLVRGVTARERADEQVPGSRASDEWRAALRASAAILRDLQAAGVCRPVDARETAVGRRPSAG